MTETMPKFTRRNYNVATRDLLIDAAVDVFSRHGYESATLAAVAKHAGANVGQIVYHFGTKDALLRICILRHAKHLSDERKRLLANYEQLVGKRGVQIEPLVRAFIDPFFDLVLSDRAGGRSYARLLARFAWRENVSEIIAKGFDEVAKLYIKAFQNALPGLNEDKAVRGFQFMLAVIYSAVSDDRRVEHLTGGASKADDYETYYSALVPFVAAGFERLGDPR